MEGTTLENTRKLQALVAEAAQRRQAIKSWRTKVRSEESWTRSQLTKFSSNSSETLALTHSLADQLGAGPALLEQTRVAVRDLNEACGAARAARTRLADLERQLADEIKKKEGQKTLGLLLLILIIGIYILIQANDKTEINRLNGEIAREREVMAGAERKLEAARSQAQQALDRLAAEADQFFRTKLDEDAQHWRRVWDTLPPFVKGDWSEESWKAHDFKVSYRLPYTVVGFAVEKPAEGAPFRLPQTIPFLGSAQVTILKGAPEATLSLMQALVTQLATAVPYGATFTLLDPSGAGRAFPMQRNLPHIRRVGVDLFRDLEAVQDGITRIIRSYLDDQTQSFEQLPEQILANERFEYIFAANFPDGYDRRTIEALQKIAKNGPAAGKYLFIQHSAEKSLPSDLSWNDFGPLHECNLSASGNGHKLEGLSLEWLKAPASGQSAALTLLGAAKPPETNVAWKELVEGDPANWWKNDGARNISALVGASGRERKLEIWFGVNREGRPCAHGILGAMPGSGKSNLYHVFICGLATRYSPEELNLYLVDGKTGVEFQPYRRLPHARVVALHSAPELSRSILDELIAEMKRRNDLFKKQAVADLASHSAAGSPGGKLPRIVLMIDEYQELFEDDRLGHASAAILQLAQQGRSAGIHLLLGSQRFGAVGMLHQTAIFGSIHLRMAMKMSQSDIQSLTEFGRDGKRLVEQCDMPGKIVVNDQSGEDKANEFGKVALLDPAERTAVLDTLVAKADAEWLSDSRFATVVFDGQEQPDFIENPQVADVLHIPVRPSRDQWRKRAMTPVHRQGFGVEDWFEGERPLALWLGQELNVHGQAHAVLRRRAMENLLLVGDNQAAIYGMLAGLLCSVPVNVPGGDVAIWLLDRAIAETPWEKMLALVGTELLRPAGYALHSTREPREATAWLDEWCREIDRRGQLTEQAQVAEPTWLFVVAGADRVPQFMRSPNKFGATTETPEGEKLRRIYREGPQLGLHLILAFQSAGSVKQALDKPQLDQFKHRVVTQMAESDSFYLVGKDIAAKLQQFGSRPIFAIHQDTIGGATSKFKPYSVEPQMPWPEQLEKLSTAVNRWKGTPV